MGGVLLLAIIAGVIWFLRRRKRKHRGEPYVYHQQDAKTTPDRTFEAMGDGYEHEMDGSYARVELPAKNKPLDGPGEIHELSAQYR